MPRQKALNPRHAAIKNYYKTLEELRSQNVTNESALRPAFQNLLAKSARLHGWTLIPELSTESRGRTVIPDGTVRDSNYLPRGYWEAKDTADDLKAEIEKKIQRGYPTSNIIFEDTQQAILYQDKREILRADLVNQFHTQVEPEIETFETHWRQLVSA